MDQQSYKWHQSPIDAILQKLNTDAACGLSHKAARSRYRKNGSNTLFDLKKKSEVLYWGDFFRDPSLIFFLCACVLTFFFSEVGVALSALGFFLIGFIILLWIRNQRKADEKKIESFRMPIANVIRDGKRRRILASRVVVGDILLLKRGDIVPCDCRLIEGQEIVVDTLLPDENGTVTWQSHPKQADLIYPYGTTIFAPFCENMLYGGSRIKSGLALAVAVEIGENSFLGAMEDFVIPAEKAEQRRTGQHAAIKEFLRRYTLIQYFSLIPLALWGIFLAPSNQSVLYVVLSLSALLAIGSQTLLSFFFQTVENQAEHTCLHSSVPENRAILKSDGVADRLSRITDVVVLGHSAISDQREHLLRCALGSGSVSLHGEGDVFALQSLCEAMLIREYAQTKGAVSDLGTTTQDDLVLQDLLKYSAFDREALSVRLSNAEIVSEGKHTQTILVNTKEVSFFLHFSENINVIDSCQGYDDCGVARVFSLEQKSELKEFFAAAEADGCRLLSVCKQIGQRLIFVGTLALREEIQSVLPSVLEEYRQSNLRISFFLFGDRTRELRYAHAAKLPSRVCCNDASVTLLDSYASNRVFLGFSRKEILTVIGELQKQGRRVAVVGDDFSDLPLLNASSVSVGCTFSAVEESLSAILTEEESSAVRRSVDLLIPKASRFGGGVSALLRAIGACREVHHRTGSVFKFLLVSQLLSALILILGLCTGNGLLSAGLLMQSGMVLTPMAILWLLSIPIPQRRLRKHFFFRFADMKAMLLSRDVLGSVLGTGGVFLLIVAPLRLLGVWNAAEGLAFVFGSLILLPVAVLLWSGQALGKRRIRKRDLLLLLLPISLIVLEGLFALLLPKIAIASGFVTWSIGTALAVPVLPLAFFGLIWIFLRKKDRTAK